MYNCTEKRWLESTCSAVREGKVLFSRNAKPGMFGLGIASKEIFLACSTQFVFLIIKLVPANVVVVTIDMCGKSSITEEWIYGITWKQCVFWYFRSFYCRCYFYFKLWVSYCLLFLSWCSLAWLCCCHYCYCFCCFNLLIYFVFLFVC